MELQFPVLWQRQEPLMRVSADVSVVIFVWNGLQSIQRTISMQCQTIITPLTDIKQFTHRLGRRITAN